MSITPADYCVSLDMAQRPELHAAMEAAGADRADYCWFRLLDDPEMEIKATRWAVSWQEAGVLADHEAHRAYSIGELWIAALRLAKSAGKCSVEMLHDIDLGKTHVGTKVDESAPDRYHTPRDNHEKSFDDGADALAELVIALHKVVTA